MSQSFLPSGTVSAFLCPRMALRPCLSLLLAATLPGLAYAKLESVQVTLNYVAKKAEERAHKPFRSPRADLPAVLRQENLDYDKYREIEFRHEKALWTEEELPFRVEFFHPGYLYQEPVHVNEFTLTHAQSIRFVQDFFNYRALHIQNQIPADTGYAGFRVLSPLNKPDKWDELGSFMGASYFRLLGKDQYYGQSARGLAVDCGEPDRPEEFPIFTDWWLGKPSRGDNQLRLYAILDSVSCVGAYEFLIQPGETTVVEVEAVLYFRETNIVHAADAQRKPLATVGLAPLTSMFWFGKNSERKFDDYRPEGLLQRERDFACYQDIFNHYNLVPSVWVQPRGNWGEGDVHLVELSTQYEGMDNVVAFWDPKTKPKPMEPYPFAYTLSWTRERDTRLSQNRVVATRIGADPRDPGKRQIVVDFEGPRLVGIPENDPPQAIASCSDNALISENQIFANPVNHSWRVILKLQPKPENKDPVDLRCTLKVGGEAVSETWTYLWSPP